jgi:hypothetical protein
MLLLLAACQDATGRFSYDVIGYQSQPLHFSGSAVWHLEHGTLDGQPHNTYIISLAAPQGNHCLAFAGLGAVLFETEYPITARAVTVALATSAPDAIVAPDGFCDVPTPLADSGTFSTSPIATTGLLDGHLDLYVGAVHVVGSFTAAREP